MKKLNCVLLIDDNKSTNFFNKKLIEICNIAEQVYETCNGNEALEFIKNCNPIKQKFPLPNLIFVDINMPIMSGFEFLQEYKKLPKIFKHNTVIVFLTTSNWEKDKTTVKNMGNLVYDYIEKPLNKGILQSLHNYYNNNFFA